MVSVVTAFVLMYFSGVTLNIISMSGLALGVGMLVDNSIVVIENIYRLRSLGVPPRKAAIQGQTGIWCYFLFYLDNSDRLCAHRIRTRNDAPNLCGYGAHHRIFSAGQSARGADFGTCWRFHCAAPPAR